MPYHLLGNGVGAAFSTTRNEGRMASDVPYLPISLSADLLIDPMLEKSLFPKSRKS